MDGDLLPARGGGVCQNLSSNLSLMVVTSIRLPAVELPHYLKGFGHWLLPGERAHILVRSSEGLLGPRMTMTGSVVA